jgi:acetolactate synthase-1/2/3 large subunit
MGYSIPAAIGAKIADPEKAVVAVCGDGSFQMQMMELATICQNDVDIKIIVMKNNKLGLVKEIQRKSYKNNEVAVDLSGSPDVVAIAKAYGIPGRSINSMDAAEDAIAEMISHNGVFLLECIVDENEPSM